MGAGGEAPAAEDLRELIRDIPDFPKPGIVFKDITPLMADPGALASAVRGLAELARPLDVQYVVAAEARGFLLGPALALALGAGFLLARKPGQAALRDACACSTRSSTAWRRSSCTPTRSSRARACSSTTTCSRPAAPLPRYASSSKGSAGAVAGCGFLVELAQLGGRRRLAGRHVHALITYES